MVTREAEKISIRLRKDSHASWLWLQAALFDVVRQDSEQQLADMYGGTNIDLTARPWVTYLRWNTDQSPRKIAEVLDNFTDAEDAIDKVFGSTPKKLSDVDLDRYYAASQSASALANSILVKYLVESVRPWFA
jgi:hypothetical protein